MEKPLDAKGVPLGGGVGKLDTNVKPIAPDEIEFTPTPGLSQATTKSRQLFDAVRHAIIESSLKLNLDLDDCDWSIEAVADPTVGYIPNTIKVVISLVKKTL